MKEFKRLFLFFVAFIIAGNLIGEFIGVVGLGLKSELFTLETLRLFSVEVILVFVVALSVSIYQRKFIKIEKN